MIPVQVEVSGQHTEIVKKQLSKVWGEPQQVANVTSGFRQGETILTFDADQSSRRSQANLSPSGSGSDYEGSR